VADRHAGDQRRPRVADLLADDATLDAYLNKSGRRRVAIRSAAAAWGPIPLAVTTPRAACTAYSGLARVRCLGDAVDPVREHEIHNDHDRRTDGRI
jgi:hypothetical protein